MIAPRTLAVRFAVMVAGLGLVIILGCGDQSGLATRYPVSGKVTFNGQPVEKGTISFVPTQADGRAASGEITNGSYSLTTATPNDGALPGSYKVTVVSKEMDTSKLKEVAKGGQFHHDADFAKAAKNAKSFVPSRYSLADTSDLTTTVAAKSNTLDFDLKD
jgi:hypothetical protein